jgi:hypothetical protein
MTKVNPWGRPISPEATGKTVVRPRIASWASEAQARAAGQPEVSSWDKPPAQPSPWNRSANPYVDREQRQAREAYAAAEAREQELIRDLARHHVRVYGVSEADARRYAEGLAESLTRQSITAGHSRQQYLDRLRQQRDYSARQASKGESRLGASAIERSAPSGSHDSRVASVTYISGDGSRTTFSHGHVIEREGLARTSVSEPKRK